MALTRKTTSAVAHPVVSQNIHYLGQGVDLLTTLDDADYARTFPPAFECAIGTHIRHIADHYDCLLRGLADGRIDYDERRRNTEIETRRNAGIAALRETIGHLQTIDATQDARKLAVHMDCGGSASAEKLFSETTLTRELQFLLSHTVHHYALVAVILRLEGRDPPQGFGVSPSTLRAWRESD